MQSAYQIHIGDCLEALRAMPDNSVDSIVTDPPYGLSKEPDMAEVLRHWLAGDDYQHKGGGFMGKTWDSFVPGPAIWKECWRVLKPGGHLLAFFGSRTYDMGTLAIRLAGFEIRDMGGWLYGSGFPKSHNLEGDWEGWGSALKPAHEPIAFARKPFKGTLVQNVLAHGTGALNIDGCRVGFENETDKATAKPGGKATAKSGNLAGKSQDGFVIFGPVVDGERLYWSVETGWGSRDGATVFHDAGVENPIEATGREPATQRAEFVAVQGGGRWPANLIHDGSEEVLALFPVNAGAAAPVKGTEDSAASVGNITGKRDRVPGAFHADSGSAARFFYCAKASRKDRHEGLDDPGEQFKRGTTLRNVENADTKGNNHPTVKPTDLMAYLCRLVTPPGGLVLDPFMGSGSTGKAAMREGFRFIGCELSEEYAAIARARIEHALNAAMPKEEPANENAPRQIDMAEVWRESV